MKGFLQEFRAFAARGNVVDLAIAVIVGGAFGKIVSSLVDNLVMPVLGVFLGGVDFSGLSLGVGGVVLTYGVFMQSIVDFLIISFVIFVAIKALNRLKQADADVTIETEKEPSEELKVLLEIRDLLAKRE